MKTKHFAILGLVAAVAFAPAAFATAAFVMGHEGIEWVAAHDDYDALAITDDGDMWMSPGFDLLIAKGEV